MTTTPTESEFGEYDYNWYSFAYWLWLAAQRRLVNKRDYIKYATVIDDVPGVSEYFRMLCHYDFELVPIYDVGVLNFLGDGVDAINTTFLLHRCET